jgi:hypothetical protein
MPLHLEMEYAAGEAQACIDKGECYCHVSMNPFAGFAGEPCHFCKEEVAREFIAWCQEDDDQEELQNEIDELGPLGPLEIINALRDWPEVWERPCQPRNQERTN